MRKLIGLLLAATLIFTSCSSNDTSSDTTSEDFIPMSYLVKRSMAQFTGQGPGGWLGECFGQNLYGAWNANDWRINDQQINLWESSDYPPSFRITYGPISWSPLNSRWTYGNTVIIKQETGEVTGSAYILDNSGHADPLEFSQDETVDLNQTRSTTTDKEISVDIGVKTTAKIGGDNVGASLEQEVSATLGIKTDVSKAEEESKGTTTTRHIATEVSPDNSSLIVINAPTTTSQTPFTMSAAWVPEWIELEANPGEARPGHYDCPKQLGWPKIGEEDCQREAGACANHKFRLNWDDFLSLIGGYNTNYPHFNPKCCESAKANIENPDKRWISMTGTQHRTYQDAATVKITDVTGQDLDALAEKHGVDDSHRISGGK